VPRITRGRAAAVECIRAGRGTANEQSGIRGRAREVSRWGGAVSRAPSRRFLEGGVLV